MGISCKQATEYIVKREEGRITLGQRYHLWRHLLICNLCRFFQQQNQLINKLIKNETHKATSLNEQEKEHIINAMTKDDTGNND